MMTPPFLELALLPFWWPQMQNLTKHLKTLSTHLWLLTQSPFSMEVTHSPVNAQLMRTLEGSFVCSRPFPLPEAQTSSDLYSLMLTPKWNVLLFSKPEGMLVGFGAKHEKSLFIFKVYGGGGGHLENTQGKGYFHVYCINWITRMRIWSGIWIAFCYCEGLIAKWPMVNLILFYLLNPTA